MSSLLLYICCYLYLCQASVFHSQNRHFEIFLEVVFVEGLYDSEGINPFPKVFPKAAGSTRGPLSLSRHKTARCASCSEDRFALHPYLSIWRHCEETKSNYCPLGYFIVPRDKAFAIQVQRMLCLPSVFF